MPFLEFKNPFTNKLDRINMTFDYTAFYGKNDYSREITFSLKKRVLAYKDNLEIKV